MSYRFTGSIPTIGQIEKLRLMLSTYQDGTGQLVFELGKTLPGWRDFERSVALAFGGVAQESKAIFDVLIPTPENTEIDFGISCKMRETLRTVERTGRVTVEVSNSAGKFWDGLKDKGIDDYNTNPDLTGKILLDLVENWHDEVSLEQGGVVNVNQSFYLLLQWHKKTRRYQLFQFPVKLPTPETLSWDVVGRRLVGRDDEGVMIEWFGYSGGQLKYYPLADQAIWSSEIFKLEPLPENELGYGLKKRVIEYFPELWQKANQM
ncbi:hypothetical protein QUF64_05580 [Anaerolineales bacterium HSG6]|nr:hypothetical protein [Anaerolineales bacterium HSG6]